MSEITYNPSPTCEKFHYSSASIRGLMGPVGSGKSVACCMEIFTRAMEQEPCKDGYRLTRFAVIRKTYPELRSTTIKTWQEWIDPSICRIVFGAPIEGRMKFELDDGTIVSSEIFFLSINIPQHVEKLLSLELTGAWINEAREIPGSVINFTDERVGRYPPKIKAPITWSGVIMDTNAPDKDHFLSHFFLKKKGFFTQPPALLKVNDNSLAEAIDKNGQGYIFNPECENVENQPLGKEYWLKNIDIQTTEHIKIQKLCEFGSDFDGKPVYPEYVRSFHVVECGIDYNDSLPLYIGFDFGRTPAAAIFQINEEGQLNILFEAISKDMGITRFGENLRDFILFKIFNLTNVSNKRESLLNLNQLCGVDPAGKSKEQTDERTCLDILISQGYRAFPATTQSYIRRREVVVNYMNKTIVIADKSESGMKISLDKKSQKFRYRHMTSQMSISQNCSTIDDGLLGGYRYRRIQVAGEDRYKDVPEKNDYSHVIEALQYGVLVADVYINRKHSNESNIIAI